MAMKPEMYMSMLETAEVVAERYKIGRGAGSARWAGTSPISLSMPWSTWNGRANASKTDRTISSSSQARSRTRFWHVVHQDRSAPGHSMWSWGPLRKTGSGRGSRRKC